MKLQIKIIFIIILSLKTSLCYCNEFSYILNDKCIENLYLKAYPDFNNSETTLLRDPRGIIFRIQLESLDISEEIFSNIKQIEYFLAKIKNPVIIEVHTGKIPIDKTKIVKNWELSTILANNIEAFITRPVGTIEQERVHSVGYGEFLPSKNTSNNGGNYSDRIDIIVLCNIIGE